MDKARLNYETHSLSSACEAVLDIGNAGNSYIDERAPWSLFKQGGASAEAGKKVSFGLRFQLLPFFKNILPIIL